MPKLYPHFRMPFNFGPHGESPATTEQNSDDEIWDCIYNILIWPKGAREDLPDFGIPDFSFGQQPVKVEAIAEAVARFEPRAQPLIKAEPDRFEALVNNVRVSGR